MPLDEMTLQRAAFALNTKLIDLRFMWDQQNQLLFTPATFDKPLQKIIFDNIGHIDAAIREFTGDQTFTGLRNFIELVPEDQYKPAAKHIEQAKTRITDLSSRNTTVFVRAIIKNEKVIMLLAMVGSRAESRLNFIKMLPVFLELNRLTPYELCACTAESFLNSGVGIYFEKFPSVYVKKEAQNQRLMDHQEFFNQNGLSVENFSFNNTAYFRISCVSSAVFTAKLKDLQARVQMPAAAVVPKMPVMPSSYVDIQTKFAQAETVIVQLKNQISEINEHLSECEEENDKLASHVSALDIQNQQLQEECSNLTAANRELEERRKELEDSCAELSQAVAKSDTDIRKLERENLEKEAIERKPNSPAAAALARQVASLQKENALLKEELASLKSSSLGPASLNTVSKENTQNQNEIELQSVSREGTSLLDRQVEKPDTSSRWCKCTIS